MDSLKILKEGNSYFINYNKMDGDYSYNIRKDKKENGQHPFAVVITCSDSRVVPEAIFNASLGELFVIRVAGNVVGEYELSSVVYALDHLKTDTVLVLGHTNCGAIGAALSSHDVGLASPLVNKIRGVISAYKSEEEATKINVLSTLKEVENYIKSEPSLTNTKFYGAIYEIDSGKVNFL